MAPVKKGKRKSKRGKSRKSRASAGSTHRKTTRQKQKTNVIGYRQKTRSRKRRVKNQKGGSFFDNLARGLYAGAAYGMSQYAQENRRKWLAKNKKQK